MRELIFVKLGGSLITDKSRPFTEKREVIKRLTREIHQFRRKGDSRILVGHGGGSYPHEPARKYQTHKGLVNEESCRGLVEVQDAAARLNRIVVEAFINSGENAVSVQPSAAVVSDKGEIKEWYTKPIEMLLEYNLLPVVYGDIGLDLTNGCCILSTEEIFRYLSEKLRPSRVIMCGKTDGVFTSDPNRDSSAEHIPEITTENFNIIRKHLSDSDGIDVTGGMAHKIEMALEIAANGSVVEIINGEKPGNLKETLSGKAGLRTIIR